MRPANRPQWVLEGDIKGCFDNISHDWILSNIPMERRILRQWLKCGYMENDCKYFNEAGTPQGGIISPVIANMVLDGLETMLNIKYKRKCHNSKTGKVYWRQSAKDSKQIHFIRYADDFIITGNSKEVLENEVKPMVKTFLAERGLELSDEKTVITPVNEGFDFLGFNIRTFKETLLVTPAGKRVKRLKTKISETITLMHGESALAVIEKLNPIIRGWTNYYRFVNSSKTFSDITHYNGNISGNGQNADTHGKAWVGSNKNTLPELGIEIGVSSQEERTGRWLSWQKPLTTKLSAILRSKAKTTLSTNKIEIISRIAG